MIRAIVRRNRAEVSWVVEVAYVGRFAFDRPVAIRIPVDALLSEERNIPTHEEAMNLALSLVRKHKEDA